MSAVNKLSGSAPDAPGGGILLVATSDIDKTRSKRIVTAAHPPSLFSFETSSRANTKSGKNGKAQLGFLTHMRMLSTLATAHSLPEETSRNLLGVARVKDLSGVPNYNLTDLGLLTRSAGSPVHYWSVPIWGVPRFRIINITLNSVTPQRTRTLKRSCAHGVPYGSRVTFFHLSDQGWLKKTRKVNQKFLQPRA